MHLVGKKCLQSQHLRGIQRKNLQAFQQLLLGMSGFNRDGPSVCLGIFFLVIYFERASSSKIYYHSVSGPCHYLWTQVLQNSVTSITYQF